MKTTLMQNKMLLGKFQSYDKSLLDDYINSFGQSDQLVQKLKREVDHLKEQL
jgi:hypothetical protein